MIRRDRMTLPGLTRRGFVGALASGSLGFTSLWAATTVGRVVTDARERRVKLGSSQKIICIGGAITETLYALGVSDRIMAVDTTSTWPGQALQEKKSIGYMRAVSSEGVIALKPDLVLAMNNAGPPAALDQIMASSVPVVFVDSTPSAEAIEGRTRFLADLLGAGAVGETLCHDISAKFRTLATWRSEHPLTHRVLFIMRMTNNRPMVAGIETAADAVIRLAGGINAGSGMTGYKIVDQESLLALRPDAVLTMEQGGEEIRKTLLEDQTFRLTPAGRAGAVFSMEGERLLGFGLRTPDAALELAQKLTTLARPT